MCVQCGVVVESLVFDSSPEWRSHDTNDRSRAGAAEDLLLPGVMQATAFGCKTQWRCVGRDPLTTLRESFLVIEGFLRLLGLSSDSGSAAWAKELFRDMHDLKPVRGDSKTSYAAAAVYFGCKLAGGARELRHVASLCGVDICLLNDAVAAFKDRLAGKAYHPRLFEAVQAGTLINMYADRLGLGQGELRRIKRAAHVLDEELMEVLDCGRAPRTICSGVLWLAASKENVRVSKRAVMAACGVCQQTIDKVTTQIQSTLQRSAAPTLPEPA